MTIRSTWGTGGAGGVTDGDKGDITVSSSGTVWTVDSPGGVSDGVKQDVTVQGSGTAYVVTTRADVSVWDYAAGTDLDDPGADQGAVATAIENALNAGVDEGRVTTFHTKGHPVADKFRVNRQIVVTGDVIRIAGHGGGTHAVGSRIEWQTGSATWGLRLESAAGATGNGSCSSGYCKNLTLTKAGSYSQDGSIGYQLRGLRQFVTDSVTVTGNDVAFDMIDNCFGSEFRNCRAPEGTGYVGMNIRTGPQSGNDIEFYNCWFAGKNAAVHISGGAGNFRFFGGQFMAGNGYTTDQDGLGVITIGKDYLTGATGNCGIIEIAGDFENSKRMYWLRGYGTVQLHVHDSAFLATDASNPLIGFSKMESLNDSKILYQNNTQRGTYSSATLVSESGANSGYGITEMNWHSTTPSTVNGVAQGAGWFRSTRHYQGLDRGYCVEFTGSNPVIRQGLTTHHVGNGSPENVVTANPGSTYRRKDGGAGTGSYVKESGTGNTGWVGK